MAHPNTPTGPLSNLLGGDDPWTENQESPNPNAALWNAISQEQRAIAWIRDCLDNDSNTNDCVSQKAMAYETACDALHGLPAIRESIKTQTGADRYVNAMVDVYLDMKIVPWHAEGAANWSQLIKEDASSRFAEAEKFHEARVMDCLPEPLPSGMPLPPAHNLAFNWLRIDNAIMGMKPYLPQYAPEMLRDALRDLALHDGVLSAANIVVRMGNSEKNREVSPGDIFRFMPNESRNICLQSAHTAVVGLHLSPIKNLSESLDRLPPKERKLAIAAMTGQDPLAALSNLLEDHPATIVKESLNPKAIALYQQWTSNIEDDPKASAATPAKKPAPGR